MGILLSDVLGSLKLLPNNDGQLDFGMSSTDIPFIKLTGLAGTAYYIFVTNQGTLSVSTAEPATNSDGLSLATTVVGTTQLLPLGTRVRDVNGNEFIYLKGVASVDATHNWVTFDADGATTLLAAGAKAPVAVFMAVVDASTKFGWAQIYGKNTIAGTDAIATNSLLYIDATSGRADDSAVTGDLIQGAISRSTDASTNIATVQLNYPQVNTKVG